MPAITIDGFSLTKKSPGFFAEVVHGAGAISLDSQPKYLVLVGGMSSSGTATPDTDLVTLLSPEDADTYFGDGSELACMAYAAFKYPGINIKAIAVAEGSGPAGATCTITMGGTWTTAGSLTIILGGGAGDPAGGATVVVDISASMVIADVGAAITAAVNAALRTFCTAANVAEVATLTTKTRSTTSNTWAVYIDKSKLPSGCTATLAGGTALPGTSTLVGKRFASGAGTRSIANVLTVLEALQLDTVVYADVDATNAARAKAAVAAKAALGVQLYEHYVLGFNAAYSAANSVAQTTLNDVRATAAWCQETESAAAVVGASMAAAIQASDSLHPNRSFDGKVLRGVAPQRFASSVPTAAEIETALNGSVTPITTSGTDAVCVMCICTRSLSGSTADYRTLDHGAAKVPDRIVQVLQLQWETEVKPQNTYVQDNIADAEDTPPEGVLTPDSYAATVFATLKSLDARGAQWLTDVDNNPPSIQYRASSKDLVGTIPIKPLPINHRVGVSVRNVTAA